MQFKLLASSPSKRKYRNQPVELDGIRFDSKAEANRYAQLVLMQRVGMISGLACHPRFPVVVNGAKVCDYVADFSYVNEAGEKVVEDVKSKATITPIYRLKKKLVHALYGVTVREVL